MKSTIPKGEKFKSSDEVSGALPWVNFMGVLFARRGDAAICALHGSTSLHFYVALFFLSVALRTQASEISADVRAAFNAQAASESVKIGPLPVISNSSKELNKSLDEIKLRISQDSKYCIENARGMASPGEYKSFFKKILDTSKVVVLQVSGSMICDGVHTSTYHYGIAFEKSTGKRLDLNRI
ncbi:hypothetical protein [Paraburkholderia sacchari]|uniref:hypothetical protein n=1 Tax=Paraburkholderia sacchari TaxID=159450 RepID=UPI0039A74CE5